MADSYDTDGHPEEGEISRSFEGTSSPPPDSSSETFRYEKTTLTLDDLDPDDWDITERQASLPHHYSPQQLLSLGMPAEGYWKMTLDLFDPYWVDPAITWAGRAAEGVLFMEDIVRNTIDGPWISELSKAAYEHVAPLPTLRHVFVTNIINRDTRPDVRRLVTGHDLQLFESGTPKYQAMLGTRIGKIVTYLVLGAFDRGTRSISRIAVWFAGRQHILLHMRFDIEPLDG
ncbi:uncharacterized protein N7482_010379 [Penicillium canariense]|uniref:Uncharacterized protein n=1 Tax=Penicillium canariense TaxID=189055 RepID=A0A9W9HKM6_9EURO|nr:uncharacterized protein N7482_010379 [Penicillium canariense]KAJ5151127.1 hypothetical protein N7482_010379 [Penicillium canariense]